MCLFPPERISAFRETVRSHFHAGPRQLPWRETGDPYRILVSEVMLQQTQAERIGKDGESTMKALRELADEGFLSEDGGVYRVR